VKICTHPNRRQSVAFAASIPARTRQYALRFAVDALARCGKQIADFPEKHDTLKRSQSARLTDDARALAKNDAWIFRSLPRLRVCAISGFVHTPDGTPIEHARVVLVGTAPASIETGRLGRFDIEVDRGTYRVSVVAPGLPPHPSSASSFMAARDSTSNSIHPLDAKQLRTISRITVDGRLALPSGTIPSVFFSRKSLEETGFNHITDALEQLPSATIARPNGGAPNAVAVVALRAPDPSETLVALDGQILNNTNTGDLDLSQFPISPFRAIEVTERLGPESASAANTIGGEVNLQSLAPTRDHRCERHRTRRTYRVRVRVGQRDDARFRAR